jgi:hypothetical protein
MRFPIFNREIEQAKSIAKDFNAQKTYNKFECHNNYIGFLGEIAFAKLLKLNDIEYTWINLVKPNWDNPDFIIGGKTFDIKTTTGDSLWIQEPKWDYYILANYVPLQNHIDFLGYIYKDRLTNIISNNPRVVVRENRSDYVLDYTKLSGINMLIQEMKNKNI